MQQQLFDLDLDKPSPAPAAITLRPYQEEAVGAVFREWGNVASTLVVCPTGTGKSVIFSEVMRRWMESNQ